MIVEKQMRKASGRCQHIYHHCKPQVTHVIVTQRKSWKNISNKVGTSTKIWDPPSLCQSLGTKLATMATRNVHSNHNEKKAYQKSWAQWELVLQRTINVNLECLMLFSFKWKKLKNKCKKGGTSPKVYNSPSLCQSWRTKVFHQQKATYRFLRIL